MVYENEIVKFYYNGDKLDFIEPEQRYATKIVNGKEVRVEYFDRLLANNESIKCGAFKSNKTRWLDIDTIYNIYKIHISNESLNETKFEIQIGDKILHLQDLIDTWCIMRSSFDRPMSTWIRIYEKTLFHVHNNTLIIKCFSKLNKNYTIIDMYSNINVL